MRAQEPNGRIVVINPNSSEVVTASIDDALDPLRTADGPVIDCLTLAEGPPGIETQCHVDGVVGPMCEIIRREDARADAPLARPLLVCQRRVNVPEEVTHVTGGAVGEPLPAAHRRQPLER